MLSKLGSVLKKSIDKIAGAIFVDKKMINSVVKDLQRALIEADVNIKLVYELSEKIKKTAASEKIKDVEKKEHIIKILHDELLTMLGGKKQELKFEKKGEKKPNVVMLLGLYGAGKTTTIAKLASYYNKRGFKTAMLGLDVHRPAAPEQLEQLAKQHKLQVFIDKKEKNPLKILKKYKKQLEKFDIIFIDSAGRDVLNKELIKEISELDKEVNPDYSILVMPADIGQTAKKQASEFQKALKIKGVIITRMDSTAKGGGALTACSETKAPVFFVTTGEKINDIETFNPSSFISRMLGMGDLESLVEKVRMAADRKKQKATEKRIKEGKLTMLDLYEQLDTMKNMGSLSKIANLVPGLSNLIGSDDSDDSGSSKSSKKKKITGKMLDSQEEKIKRWRYIIQSMTQEEIENPEIIEKQTSRISRIAKGAGITTSEVRALLKQYKILKEFSKSSKSLESGHLSQKQMMKLAKKFGKKFGKKIRV